MTSTFDAVDELERINKMTPDEAYRESVATTGRASGITDAQDAAARIPEAEMQRRRAAGGVQNPAQPVAAGNTPSGMVMGADGQLRYDNGKLVGAAKPANYEQLDSTQMMRRMEQGLPAKADPDYERWRAQVAYDRMSLDEKKRLHDQRNGLLADTILRGIAQVNNGGGEIYENGGKTYRRVKFSGKDQSGPVTDLNKMREQMGKDGRMGALGVYLEVNPDGTKVEGAQPRIWYSHIGSDGGKGVVKEIDNLGTVQEQWVKKYLADNPAKDAEGAEDRLRAARRVAADRFGGNYAGWDLTPTVREQFEAKQKAEAEKLAVANKELDQKDAQFYAGLGFNKDKLAEERRQFDQKFGLDEKKYAEAVREFDASLDAQQKDAADKLGVRKMEILANIGAKVADGGKTGDILRSLPQSFVKSYIEAEVPELDENGNPMLNEATGVPMSRKPTTEEMRQRFDELKGLAEKAYGAASGNAYYDNLAAQLDGAASAAQPAQAAATPSIGKDGNLVMQDGTVVKPGATFTNKNGVTMRWKGGDINAWEPVGDKGGKSVLEPLKQVNGGATTSQQDIQNPAPQKPNDDSGKRWDAYISATLREAFPSDEITPDAIASGAYDGPLAQIAKESNDPAFAKYVDDLLKRNSESRQKKDAEKAAQAKANYEKELKLNRIRKAKPKSASPITDSFMAVPMP